PPHKSLFLNRLTRLLPLPSFFFPLFFPPFFSSSPPFLPFFPSPSSLFSLPLLLSPLPSPSLPFLLSSFLSFLSPPPSLSLPFPLFSPLF
ncbi:hypothetical protein ACXWRS_10290, partial [Streptococcus pyogenes]